MTHSVTSEDQEFKDQVELCEYPASQFDHKAHLRLAYVYLVQNKDNKLSIKIMRESLTRLLIYAGVNPSAKYHAILTEAWMLAVHHFINNKGRSISAEDFIRQNPVMLDSKIMLTHYSDDVLFSEKARKTFIEPNLDPIPKYESTKTL